MKTSQKIQALIETLPILRKYRGEKIVVKYGGSFMNHPDLLMKSHVAMDLALLNMLNIKVVTVHGGGKAISTALEHANIKSVFQHGLRVTDEASIHVVKQTLNDQVNPDICALIQQHGGHAIRIKGNHITHCEKLTKSPQGEPIDIGFVGRVTSVDTHSVEACLEQGQIPVVSPLASGPDKHVYNVNADTAAGAMASAIKAKQLIYLSDVPGLLADVNDPHSLIKHLNASDVPKLIKNGTISTGMLPKIESALHALKCGVESVQLMDGRIPHVLLSFLLGESVKCTEIRD